MTDPRDGSTRRTPGESRRVTDEKLFRYLIDFEVQKAQRLQYCISVIYLGSDLPAAEASRLSTPHVLDAILRRTRATDAVTVLPETSFAILLIDAETTTLAAIIGRLTEELAALTGTTPGRHPATWSAGAACYPKTATGGRHLLQQAHDLMVLARQGGGDRFYVAS